MITLQKGCSRHHTVLYLMHWDYTKEEMDRPLVGIVSSYNEIVPGHMNLDKIVECCKNGCRRWQAEHRLYFRPLQSVTELPWDISGMKYSLVTRDLICRFYRVYGNGTSV